MIFSAFISSSCSSLNEIKLFSHDVMAAIFVSQNNETAAMFVSQTSPVGVELFSYVNAFFCSNEFAWMLATWVKTQNTVCSSFLIN